MSSTGIAAWGRVVLGIKRGSSLYFTPDDGHIDARKMLSYEHRINFIRVASSWFSALLSFPHMFLCHIYLPAIPIYCLSWIFQITQSNTINCFPILYLLGLKPSLLNIQAGPQVFLTTFRSNALLENSF
jgi:hypothetical protein